jgi:hypothetical protein
MSKNFQKGVGTGLQDLRATPSIGSIQQVSEAQIGNTGGGSDGIPFTPAATTVGFLPFQYSVLDLATSGNVYGKTFGANTGTSNFRFDTINPFTAGDGCIQFTGETAGGVRAATTVDRTADFTLEANMYGTNTTPMGFGLTSEVSAFTNGNDIIFRYAGSNLITISSAFTNNTWFQVVIMRTSGIVYLGVNGTWSGTTYNMSGAGAATGYLYAGERFPGDTALTTGRFSNVRASNAAIYSTTSWTPPTAMFTS